MVPNSRDRSITSDTVVEELSAVIFGTLQTMFLEPLERELAVQVEYDMDEQGASMNEYWRMPMLTF